MAGKTVTAPVAPLESAQPRLAIEIEGLRKLYGATVGVLDVTLRVPRASLYGIVGPNGAGKSTTVGCLLGLLAPDAGRVSVLGLSPRTSRTALFTRVGVKLQEDEGVWARLRAEEALELFASFYGDPVPPAELLREFGLEEKGRSFFRELSGGQRVRLLVALALVGRPELLVLDEPTTGLDPQSRYQLWERLRDQRDRGVTVLVTTHYIEEAEEHCDEVAIIDEGQVVVHGPPPRLLFDARLEGRIAFPAPEGMSVDVLSGLAGVSHVERVGARMHVFGHGPDLHAGVARVAEEWGVGRMALESRPVRLADLYLIETGRDYRKQD